MFNLVWYRSDLRIQDNPALYSALRNEQGEVRAVFCITERQWQQHNWGNNKIGFVLSHVLKLQAELARFKIQLDIIQCDWFSEVADLLCKYATKYKCTQLFFNKEYELNEQTRDQNVMQSLTSIGIFCRAFDDQCLIPPGTILNKQKDPYTIFTPFKKACYGYLESHSIAPLPKLKAKASKHVSVKNGLPRKYQRYLQNPILDLWPVGEEAAIVALKKFCAKKLLHYQAQRDFPDLDATSKLSAYLATGSISMRTCFNTALRGRFPGSANIMCWIDELLWRDFYRNIIFHHPRICKLENFNKKYDHLKWKKYPAHFEKWANGKTGIPIIDAAMRQLIQTGWMHNRLRMITATFLTKHLLIDWRHGEKFFSEHLIDLDFASNNGGWQWCASTGTDAVPYFRIFNPISQSKKFDSQGDFIRKYCPELQNLSNREIHDPSAYLTSSELSNLKYPRIMVNLSNARLRALEVFGASNAGSEILSEQPKTSILVKRGRS